MKNLTALAIATMLISLAGSACKNNPLTSYTKQYRCEISGQPEPVTADDYVKRAFKHFEDNNYKNDAGDCALSACSEAVRLDPKSADAYYCRASMYRDKGERDNAIADMDEAIRLKTDQAQYYGTRALLYADTNAYDKAIADMSKKIEMLKDGATFNDYNSRGDYYYEFGKYEDALKDYNEAVRLKPDYPYNYSDRANAYEKLGKTDLAAADNKKFDELDLAEKEKDAGANVSNGKTGDSRTIAGGLLNDKAITMPQPPYPPAARAVHAVGKVVVNIEVDTKGNVVKAEASSGHPLLKAAAVAAARAAKFKPGPSPVSGSLEYEFKQ